MTQIDTQFKAKDITGFRYHMVTAIEPTIKRSADGSIVWIMECDCGKRFERSAGLFRKSKSCGCLMKNNSGQRKQKDLTGYKSPTSIALRPTDKRKHTYTVWVMQCLECGEEFETAAYNITRGKAIHGCRKWQKAHRSHARRQPLPNSQSYVNSIYSHYKVSARGRGIPFDLTREEVRILIEQDCHYCGAKPIEKKQKNLYGSYAWNGIDRKDNNLGYAVANCAPCCTQCNFAKLDKSVDDFLDWIKRIAQHQGLCP